MHQLSSLVTCYVKLLHFEDIDECSEPTNVCDINAQCFNTIGSFTCVCNDGYLGNGLVCDGMLISHSYGQARINGFGAQDVIFQKASCFFADLILT